MTTVRTVISGGWGGVVTEAGYGESQNRPSEIPSAPLAKFCPSCFPGSFNFWFWFISIHAVIHPQSVAGAPLELLFEKLLCLVCSPFLMEMWVTHAAVFHEAICHTMLCPWCSRYTLFLYPMSSETLPGAHLRLPWRLLLGHVFPYFSGF